MISDLDIDRIATAVSRKMTEAELDRLLEDLAFEERLATYEAERRRLLADAARRRRWFGLMKAATVALLALIYVLMFEGL